MMHLPCFAWMFFGLSMTIRNDYQNTIVRKKEKRNKIRKSNSWQLPEHACFHEYPHKKVPSREDEERGFNNCTYTQDCLHHGTPSPAVDVTSADSQVPWENGRRWAPRKLPKAYDSSRSGSRLCPKNPRRQLVGTRDGRVAGAGKTNAYLK